MTVNKNFGSENSRFKSSLNEQRKPIIIQQIEFICHIAIYIVSLQHLFSIQCVWNPGRHGHCNTYRFPVGISWPFHVRGTMEAAPKGSRVTGRGTHAVFCRFRIRGRHTHGTQARRLSPGSQMFGTLHALRRMMMNINDVAATCGNWSPSPWSWWTLLATINSTGRHLQIAGHRSP